VRPSSEAEEQGPKPEMLKTKRLLMLEEGHGFGDEEL